MTVARPAVALARLRRWAPTGLEDVLRVLETRGGRAVLVGGAVRDAFLGRRTHDWDVATSLPPSIVADAFPRVVRAGEKHGTIMVITTDGPVEVTTFRSEGAYLDGRHPETVEFHQDLEADLARRDFTINALAAELHGGEVVDPFGGVDDLRRRRVRCVGEPLKRFGEDGLRPLRAVRFAAVLDFRLDAPTARAIPAALASFALVSRERKRDELERLFARGIGFARIGRLLLETGLLATLAPELTGVRPAALVALDRLPPGRPWLRLCAWAALAGITPERVGALLRDWRVSTSDTRLAEGWLRGLARLSSRAPHGAELRRWLSTTGEGFAEGAAQLSEALRSKAFGGFTRRVRATLARDPVLSVTQLAIGGQELMAAGLSGPAVGQTLRALLDAVLDQPKLNRPKDLLALAHRLSTGSPS